MHILYVDESGVPEDCPGSDHFVLLGLAVPLKKWRALDEDLRGLLVARRLPNVEIHAAWMARRYPEQDRISGFDALGDDARRDAVRRERRKDIGKASLDSEAAARSLLKNYKKTEAYTHLSHRERVDLLCAVADRLASWTDTRLFADAHRKADLSKEQRANSRELALEQLTTRFSRFLEQYCGDEALGIVVHDQHQAASTRLTSLFRSWHTAGTRFRKITNIAETPLFVDSALTAMVQVADLAAFATRRFFEKNETNLFNRIYKRFDRVPSGELVGLRHFTGKAPCTCRVCKDHRRLPTQDAR